MYKRYNISYLNRNFLNILYVYYKANTKEMGIPKVNDLAAVFVATVLLLSICPANGGIYRSQDALIFKSKFYFFIRPLALFLFFTCFFRIAVGLLDIIQHNRVQCCIKNQIIQSNLYNLHISIHSRSSGGWLLFSKAFPNQTIGFFANQFLPDWRPH